ncbi:uncharacterized protein LOC128189639 isoform X1 [Crassostrea angulata]|uniref:uncharacterized protein LOC128189639 isoform X1 n=1 Tax=Magallana angulata TaxID=2784310 RepID=UPI0022B182D8|nr:uncharacterized protein LOC128189639 isoform X1 [Crassostrea angulata]
MCLGQMFKRNYTFTQQPACTPCECDDSCVRRATCCPSKFYRQTDTPDFIEYQHNVNVTENDVPLSCAEPLWNPIGIKTGKSYWMVETCPDEVICISPPSENVSSSTPVTSLATNQTYSNMQCALCNQEEVPNLVTWEKKKICIMRSDLMSPEDISTLYQSVISESPICNVGFYPPTSTEHVVKPCVTYTYDVNCNDVELRILIDISYLTKACQENYLPYYSNRKLYKNVFCALCEFNVFDLNIQYGDRGIFDDSIITPFSALMNFQQVVEAPSTKNSRCKENQIFDETLKKCLDIQCEAEYIYQNSACSLIHKMLEAMNYEVNLVVTSADDTSVEIYTTSVVDSLQGVLQLYNLTDYLCRMVALVPSDHSDGNFLAVVIELSIQHLHDVDNMIQHLIDIFNSHQKLALIVEPLIGEVNLSLSLVGQSFHVYGSALFEKSLNNRLYINPMSGKELIVYQSENLAYDGYNSQRSHCFRGHMMSTVADWYRCPKVKIKSADAKIGVSNFTVCLIDYDACFASYYFKESLDKRSVYICLDQYLKAVEATKGIIRTADDSLMAPLSLACLSLSSLGSLATIFTFIFNRPCSRIADVNIIILAAILIFANTVHTVSKYFLWSQTLCIGVGMLVHFCWLSVICWMSLSSFQIFHTFTSFNLTKVKVIPRVLTSLMVNLFICSSLVATNVIQSYVTSNGENLGYSVLTCYIADPEMILYTFTLPVGLLVCINIFMLAVTVFRISNKVDVQKSKDKERTGAYFRLSTIAGATWIFGFLDQFTGFQFFSILHTLFNGGQGVFLYLAFGAPLPNIKSIVSRSHASKSVESTERY